MIILHVNDSLRVIIRIILVRVKTSTLHFKHVLLWEKGRTKRSILETHLSILRIIYLKKGNTV